jgi:hypothetical protein
MVPTAAFMGHVVQPSSWSPQKLMPCAGGEEDLAVCTLNAELLPSAMSFLICVIKAFVWGVL